MIPPWRPKSLYFPDLLTFFGWSPGLDPMDPFRIGLVPLRPRAGQPAGLLVQVGHDFDYGYVENGDKYPQGTDDPNTYNFSYWQYVDQFVYFSHHRVTIPPPWWINAAHQNGIPVLGTLIFEGDDSQQDLHLLVNTRGKNGSPYRYVDLLVGAAEYYGFDGWLWNVEAPLPPNVSVEAFEDFVKALTHAMHEKLPGSLVIWYDALTVDGDVTYQNALNDKNNAFFLATDGIFTNYWWSPDPELRTSVETAKADGRSPRQVYTGIDVLSRDGEDYRPGPGIYEPLGQCVEAGTSAAVFAPVWSFWEATSREQFEERDELLWTGRTATHCPGSSVEGVAQHVPERQVPAGLPLATNFDQGQGKRFWVEGRPGSSRGWSNLSLQGLLPTWRFCAPSGTGPFTAGWDQAAAFDGGTSLRFSAPGATGQEEVVYRLFAAHAALDGPLLLTWSWQPVDPVGYPQIRIVLAFSDDTSRDYAAESTHPVGNGWRTSTCRVGALPAGKTLAKVDVRVGPSDHGVVPVDYGVRIGALSVTPQPWPAPVSVQDLAPRGASWTGNLVTLYLLWSYAANAARYYDVWQLHADGSATWLVRAACNAAWLDGVASAPGDEVVVTIAVQPVDYAGVRQPLDQAATIQLKPGAPG
ncbi:MAG TPA: endo-beta-N-acetylglucosaminidase [Longimicrobiaceae bacterium]